MAISVPSTKNLTFEMVAPELVVEAVAVIVTGLLAAGMLAPSAGLVMLTVTGLVLLTLIEMVLETALVPVLSVTMAKRL